MYVSGWEVGQSMHSINESVYILNEVESGAWDLYLEIADAAPRMQRVLEYNILAVNQVPAVQKEGMNDLLRALQVNNALVSTQSSLGNWVHCSNVVVYGTAILVLGICIL